MRNLTAAFATLLDDVGKIPMFNFGFPGVGYPNSFGVSSPNYASATPSTVFDKVRARFGQALVRKVSFDASRRCGTTHYALMNRPARRNQGGGCGTDGLHFEDDFQYALAEAPRPVLRARIRLENAPRASVSEGASVSGSEASLYGLKHRNSCAHAEADGGLSHNSRSTTLQSAGLLS